MNSQSDRKSLVHCANEYDTLQRVIVCKPRNMEIQEVINDVQKRYKNENINIHLAMKQHDAFTRELQKHGTDVITLPALKEFPEQVFTRDIGFTIGDRVFIANMGEEIRQGEEETLQFWLKSNHIPFREINGSKVEGGDVIVNGQTIYIGMSSRTSASSLFDLQKECSTYEIVPVSFDEKYLHLDCVFNILSEDTALIFSEAINPKTVQLLKSRFTLIEVSADEQFSLGTNVLSIGDKKLLSQPQNKNVNKAMRDHGFDVIEIDFSEIIKSGGSFRCCSMPTLRG